MNRGCVVFLLDDSAWMRYSVTDAVCTRADCVATVINTALRLLTQGTPLDVALVGYHREEGGALVINTRWGGAFTGRKWVSTTELLASPLRTEIRAQVVLHPVTQLPQTENLPFPVWLEPETTGGVMSRAVMFDILAGVLQEWVTTRRPAVAPLVLSFLSELSPNELLAEAVKPLMRVHTPFGFPLLYQFHLATNSNFPPLKYPSDPQFLPPGPTQDLFYACSPLSDAMLEGLRQNQETVVPGSKGMVYNGRMADIFRFIALVRAYQSQIPPDTNPEILPTPEALMESDIFHPVEKLPPILKTIPSSSSDPHKTSLHQSARERVDIAQASPPIATPPVSKPPLGNTHSAPQNVITPPLDHRLTARQRAEMAAQSAASAAPAPPVPPAPSTPPGTKPNVGQALPPVSGKNMPAPPPIPKTSPSPGFQIPAPPPVPSRPPNHIPAAGSASESDAVIDLTLSQAMPSMRFSSSDSTSSGTASDLEEALPPNLATPYRGTARWRSWKETQEETVSEPAQPEEPDFGIYNTPPEPGTARWRFWRDFHPNMTPVVPNGYTFRCQPLATNQRVPEPKDLPPRQTLVVLVIDRSVSDLTFDPARRMWEHRLDKAGFLLGEMVRCGRRRYDVAIVYYGRESDEETRVVSNTLGRSFVSDAVLSKSAGRVESFVIQYPNGIGGSISLPRKKLHFTDVNPTLAADPVPAFERAAEVIREWQKSRKKRILKPVVLHITAGTFQMERYAEAIQQLPKGKDPTCLLHWVFTERPHIGACCPEEEGFTNNERLRQLWRSTSALPAREFLAEIRPGIHPDSRGIMVNMDYELLFEVLDTQAAFQTGIMKGWAG